MLLSTPLKPIDYSLLKGDFFELTDQVFKRIESGTRVIEIAALSELAATEIEERFNYLSLRRNLPLYFTLTQTRPDVYRVELDIDDFELVY